MVASSVLMTGGDGFDGDGFLHRTRMEREIVAHDLIDGHDAAGVLQALETGKFGGNIVGADANEVDAIVAVLIGDRVNRCPASPRSTAVILAPAMIFPLESETVPTRDVVVAICA